MLVVPLILPVAAEYGFTRYIWASCFLATMELGYLTPPVGLNLFISSYRFEKSIGEIYWATLPFLMVLLVSRGHDCILARVVFGLAGLGFDERDCEP